MHKEEVENKLKDLKDLREELEETQEEYADVTSEIEDLSWGLSNLEYEQYRLKNKEIKLEKEIKDLEKQLMNKEFEELDNTLTGDKFRDAFIKCSWFCSKYENYNDLLTYVKITGKRLMATDGYRGIIVECNNIPENLKNTYIRWDVRNNFTENANPIVGASNYLEVLDKRIQECNDNQILLINESKFKEMFYHESRKESDKNITILKHLDVKVAFNQDYLETILRAFKNMDIEVYWPECWYEPIMIRSQYQSALLLPIRLGTGH